MTRTQLDQILSPLGYTPENYQDQIVFWKKIQHHNTSHPQAFTVLLCTLYPCGSLNLAGLNEAKLRKEIRAGQIQLESAQDVEALKQSFFHQNKPQTQQVQRLLEFVEKQIQALEQHQEHEAAFQNAADNFAMLCQALV